MTTSSGTLPKVPSTAVTCSPAERSIWVRTTAPVRPGQLKPWTAHLQAGHSVPVIEHGVLGGQGVDHARMVHDDVQELRGPPATHVERTAARPSPRPDTDCWRCGQKTAKILNRSSPSIVWTQQTFTLKLELPPIFISFAGSSRPREAQTEAGAHRVRLKATKVSHRMSLFCTEGQKTAKGART
jgi:hypothetical protein